MNFDSNTLRDIVMVLVPMILSLTVHEFAHAWSAHRLGDDTASSQGRMTLNPLAHIDLFGTILIPIIPIIAGGSFALIGWAKPVPVSPYRFRRGITMRKGMIITALAGPGSNLILAFISAGVLAAMQALAVDAEKMGALVSLMLHLFYMNIGLAIFNMLPVFPLDGSRVLPQAWQEKMARYTMMTMIGLLVAINFLGEYLFMPVSIIAKGMLAFWGLIF